MTVMIGGMTGMIATSVAATATTGMIGGIVIMTAITITIGVTAAANP